MTDDFDADEFERTCRAMAEQAHRTSQSMKRLQSAFTVLGIEVREMIDIKRPNLPTAAKEICESGLLRAQRNG